MFHFDQLVKLSFWFTPRPGEAGVYFARSAILFGLLFLIALVLWLFIAKIKKKGFNPIRAKLGRKIYTCLFTVSLIGGVLVFFRAERIPYLSIRFLVLLLFITFIVWLILILRYYLRKYKSEMVEYEEFQRKQKYLK